MLYMPFVLEVNMEHALGENQIPQEAKCFVNILVVAGCTVKVQR